jgi:hypothetical protein
MILPSGGSEREMAVIAFIKGFHEREAGPAKLEVDLLVPHAAAPRDVDRTAHKMKAVRRAADGAIMLPRAGQTGHNPPAARQLRGARGVG